MPNTYTQLFVHIVFAVKGREYVLQKDHKDELHKYISGIITNKKQKLYIINSVADHVHLLVSISPDISISDLVRDIKSNSSRFINEKKWYPGKFSWQTGFGAFSVSYSQIVNVIEYISKQEEHHKTSTFKKEYLMLLEKYNVDYNEKYLFDWIE